MNNYAELDMEKILERKDFHKLPRKQQRELMQYWRENFPTSVIREKMGYSSGTAFYNLLKRLKLPTNVARVRIEDDLLEDDLAIITDENDDNNQASEKNSESESNIEVLVSLIGEVSLKDLPELVVKAHESGFELEIKEIMEEIKQTLEKK